MATYGYARVSRADQNEARQIVALRNAGIDDTRIFIDHRSGKDFNGDFNGNFNRAVLDRFSVFLIYFIQTPRKSTLFRGICS